MELTPKFALTLQLHSVYCDMTPEKPEYRSQIRSSLLGNDSVTHSRGNKYESNNRVTSVAMQRRCKHDSSTIERLCFLRGPCKIVIKKSSVVAVQ
jgi:hypothetical protein